MSTTDSHNRSPHWWRAAPALLVTHIVDHPFGVAFHPVGPPDLFGQILRERFPRCFRHEHADEVRLGCFIYPLGPWRCFARQVPYVAHGHIESRNGRLRIQREEDKRNKRFYRLSAVGKGVLKELLAEWQAINASVSRIVGSRSAA